MSGREKPLVAHVIQKLEKWVVEPRGIEDPDRFQVQAELKPSKYLDHLFESADASRQHYEGIRKLSHALFALVHGLNRNELGKAVMCALLGNHRARDNSDYFAAGGQRGIGQYPHQPSAATAIDDS